ncbi:hypothetical protein Tco_0215052 [Tanacetum coccineum]
MAEEVGVETVKEASIMEGEKEVLVSNSDRWLKEKLESMGGRNRSGEVSLGWFGRIRWWDDKRHGGGVDLGVSKPILLEVNRRIDGRIWWSGYWEDVGGAPNV